MEIENKRIFIDNPSQFVSDNRNWPHRIIK